MGYLVRGPLGGQVWHHVQYVLGLARLGHEVYFFEDSGESSTCYDPTRGTVKDPTYGLRFAEVLFRQLGIPDCWAYYDRRAEGWIGPCAGSADEIARTADVLLNVSGVNPIRPGLEQIPVRVLIDTDPAFTQIKHLADPAARESALRHNVFFSFGENIGTPASGVPDDGLPWAPTRQPIVMDCWPMRPGPRDGKFTTVMLWRSYRPVEYGGREYGMKSESFEPFWDLPPLVGSSLELVLGSATAPLALLREYGWLVRDPFEITVNPWNYRRYLRQSKAEFGIAKHGYVASRSGWFSERTAAYLASGRPALVQDTGFSTWMRAGAGVVPFSSLDDAVAGVQDINEDYDRHCRGARALAAEYFDSDVVLTSLLDRATPVSGVAAFASAAPVHAVGGPTVVEGRLAQ